MWMSFVLAVALEVVRFEDNLMIPMRDGVRLATDIYRPARGGAPLDEKLPVLLQRTPYGKTGAGLVESARYFAANGYVVALQDVRGTYASEGVFTKYIGEGQDGFDTIEYLAKLPYANGKVGMWGTSYAAHVQANAAKLRPPSLATIVLNMGGMSNGWDHKVRNHGAFELQQLTWAFRQLEDETDDPLVKAHLARSPIESWLEALPLRKGLNPLSIAPNFEDYILEMATHGDYDDDYWKHRDVNWQEHYDATLDIPMVHVSGWYDSYAGGTIQNFVELSKRKTSLVTPPDGTLDSRRQYPLVRGRRGVRRRGRETRLPSRVPPAMVRPFLEERRSRPGRAGSHLHYGRRGWAQGRERPPVPRREVGLRIELAPTRSGGDSLLHSRRRFAFEDPSGGARKLDDLHLRSARPGADDGRRFLEHEPGLRAGRLSPGGARGNLRSETAVSSAERPSRRSGVPDRAPRRRRRSRGAHRGRATCVIDRSRHRLHREARRRLSPIPGFPFGLRDEPHGRHTPSPVPQRPRAPGADEQG